MHTHPRVTLVGGQFLPDNGGLLIASDVTVIVRPATRLHRARRFWRDSTGLSGACTELIVWGSIVNGMLRGAVWVLERL